MVRIKLAALGVWMMLALPKLLLAVEPPALDVDRAMMDDASLRAVQFVDPDQGWIVGDYGVILRTQDGGTNWVHQSSGVTCRLTALHFDSPKSGIVVGGWYEADTGLSRGVVLQTKDGGETWNDIPAELPMLHRVRRMSSGTIVVVGDWSTTYHGSVLYTDDRGLNWANLDGSVIGQVRAADLSGDSIQLVDEQGILHRTETLPELPIAVSVVGPTTFLRTDGDLMLAGTKDLQAPLSISRDGGRKWIQPEVGDSGLGFVPLAGYSLGGRVEPDHWNWAAGIPGSTIARVDSSGAVSLFPTSSDLPIHGLFFLDNFRGWAVGAYGSILTTRDGGQTWRPQRDFERGAEGNQRRRAMVMGVAQQAHSLPWSAVASESLEAGRRIALAISDGLESSDPLAGNLLERCRDAATRVGGGEVVGWNEVNLDAILQGYRPRVVVLGSDLTPQQRDAWLAAAIRQGVLRVFEVTEGARADVVFPSSAVLPAAAAITGDLWNAALEVVQPHRGIGEQLSLQSRWDQSQARALRNLADGLPTTGTIRKSADGRRRNLQVLQARSNERALVDRLAEEASQLDLETINKRIRLLLEQTPADNRQRFLRAVLERCETRGDNQALRLYLAALAFAANELSDTGLGRWARLRYDAIRTSREWQPLLDDPSLTESPESDLNAAAQATPAVYGSPFERQAANEFNGGLGATNRLPSVAGAGVDRGDFAGAGVAQASAADTESSPGVLRPLTSVDVDMIWRFHPANLVWKNKFAPEAIEAIDKLKIEQLAESVSAGLWKNLLGTAAVRPVFAKSVAGINSSTGTSNRPLLDGVLDDPCWHESPQATPASRGNSSPFSMLEVEDVRFAYDAEFFYVGIRERFTENDANRSIERRVRDTEMNDVARVVLELDLDHDLMTRYKLTVDQRGRTRDTCDGFTAWQPRWYVATDVNDGVRTVEAAIRREALTQLPPVRGERWRIRASLLRPGEISPKGGLPDPTGWRDLIFE